MSELSSMHFPCLRIWKITMKKGFRTEIYQMSSDKIENEKGIRFALLSDLHGLSFGEKNSDLRKAIQENRTDAVLAAGDMIVRRDEGTMERAGDLLAALAGEFPVIFAPGNHESSMEQSQDFSETYQKYEDSLRAAGVFVLKNQRQTERIAGMDVTFYGLDLPLEYYHKPASPMLTKETLTELLGEREKKGFGVLLAHNPKYGKAYLDWGVDLTVCGHYHGGVVRFTRRHGLTCPQYLFLPPYCCGDFHKNGRHMVVSAGLGEHTIPLRIHNPRELLIIHMKKGKKD